MEKDVLLLGIDLETTGLDPAIDKIIEVGVILWSVKYQTPIHWVSQLVWPACEIGNQIKDITGLSSAMLAHYGNAPEVVCQNVAHFMDTADYLVAHNAGFEKSFLKHYFQEIETKKWIDTKTDIPYPAHILSRDLGALCYAHKVFNPFPHRAITDVLVMMQILGQYDFDTVRQRSQAARYLLLAEIPFGEKEKAYELGLRWSGSEGCHTRTVLETELHEQLEALSHHYPITVIPPDFIYEERVRLIAKVEKEERDKAKTLGYRWDPHAKYWYKEVRKFLEHEECQKAHGKFLVYRLDKEVPPHGNQSLSP